MAKQDKEKKVLAVIGKVAVSGFPGGHNISAEQVSAAVQTERPTDRSPDISTSCGDGASDAHKSSDYLKQSCSVGNLISVDSTSNFLVLERRSKPTVWHGDISDTQIIAYKVGLQNKLMSGTDLCVVEEPCLHVQQRREGDSCGWKGIKIEKAVSAERLFCTTVKCFSNLYPYIYICIYI